MKRLRYVATFSPSHGEDVVFTSVDFEHVMKRFKKELDALIERDKKICVMTEFSFSCEVTR